MNGSRTSGFLTDCSAIKIRQATCLAEQACLIRMKSAQNRLIQADLQWIAADEAVERSRILYLEVLDANNAKVSSLEIEKRRTEKKLRKEIKLTREASDRHRHSAARKHMKEVDRYRACINRCDFDRSRLNREIQSALNDYASALDVFHQADVRYHKLLQVYEEAAEAYGRAAAAYDKAVIEYEIAIAFPAKSSVTSLENVRVFVAG